MSNAIPLLEGTAASGGYHVPDETVQGAFQRGIDRQSAVMALSRVRPVNGKKVQLTEYVGRPTAAFVAEGAAKTATGAEYAQVTLDIKKIAAIVMYTEELIEDAQDDPTVLINNDVRAAFADLIDSHALGRNAAGVRTCCRVAAMTSPGPQVVQRAPKAAELPGQGLLINGHPQLPMCRPEQLSRVLHLRFIQRRPHHPLLISGVRQHVPDLASPIFQHQL